MIKLNKYFWISLSVLIFGILINQGISFLISLKYDSLPILNDFFLDNLPYFNLVWLFDLLSLISLGLFSIYLYKNNFKNFNFILLVFGLSQIMRGLFIGLTPFGSPKICQIGLFNGSAFRSGVFYSGHTANSFLCFLLSKGIWKYIFLILTFLIGITLLLGRGHYSIDIFSAFFFCYAIYSFSLKYFKNFIDDKSRSIGNKGVN